MSFIVDIRTHRIRSLKTLSMYFLYVIIGLSFGVIGPTLLDLKIAVDGNIEEIALILPGRSGAFAIGSALTGILVMVMRPSLIAIGSLIFATITFVLIPFNRTLVGLVAAEFINSMVLGSVDGVGNPFIMNLWGDKSAPYIQCLHFAYGLGAFIAPFFAKPYLLPLRSSVASNLTSIDPSDFNTSLANQTDSNQFITDYTYDDLKIHTTYFIIAFISLLATIFFTIMYCVRQTDKPYPTSDVDKLKFDNTKSAFSERKNLIMFALSLLFINLFAGLEFSFGTLFPTYVVQCRLHLTKSQASDISSFFWGCFTFCRILTAFTIDKLGSTILLAIDIILILLSNAVLIFYGEQHVWALWLGVALMGLGSSSMFPTTLTYLCEIMKLNERSLGAITFAGRLGEFICVFIVSKYLENHPQFLIHFTLYFSVACAAAFGLMAFLRPRLYKLDS